MKLKLIPKNEQELSKLFVLIFPLTLLLASFTSFLKDAYFTFANLIPNNRIFNYGFLDILNKEIEKRPEVKKEVEKEIKENKKLDFGPDPDPGPPDSIARNYRRGRAQAMRTGEHKKDMAGIGGLLGLGGGMGAAVLAVTAAAIAGMGNPELAEFIRYLQDVGIITLGTGGMALAMSAPLALGTIIGALKGYFKGKEEEEAFNKALADLELQNKS